MPTRDAASPPSVRLRARVVDGNAMLTRLASVLGPFSIDHFEYVVGSDDEVLVVIGVRGGPWHVERVAAKIDRLIGVRDVVIDAAS